jgi:hypothetical protein
VCGHAGAHTLVVVAGVVGNGADLNETLLISGGDALANAVSGDALLGVAALADE